MPPQEKLHFKQKGGRKVKNPTYVSRELTECIHKMYCQLKSSAGKKDVGLFFTASLALGSLLIPSEELLETFLGDLEKIRWTDVAVSAALAGLIIITLLGRFREFAFAAFAPDLAQVDRLKVKKYELAFMLILALGVAIGIKLIGTLLVSALIIVPAATAKIFSTQIRALAVWSMLLGLASTLVGLIYSIKLNSPPGPTIILAGSVLFFLAFILHSLFKTRS